MDAAAGVTSTTGDRVLSSKSKTDRRSAKSRGSRMSTGTNDDQVMSWVFLGVGVEWGWGWGECAGRGGGGLLVCFFFVCFLVCCCSVLVLWVLCVCVCVFFLHEKDENLQTVA